jgi:hypothetical protein
MIIAKQTGDNLFILGTFTDLFPDSSFPADGPNAEWYRENNCYQINLNVPYDPETQELRSVDPYLSDGWVYTSRAFIKGA